MSWIDDAEKRRIENDKTKEQDNKVHLLNQEENYKHFYHFTEELNSLLLRVNELTYEERKPSLELGFTEIEGNKCYEYYGSAYIYKKGLFVFFSGSRYKTLCWRRINFKITDEYNILKIHINEAFTEKDMGVLISTDQTKDKYKLRIDGIDEKLLQLIIDWLTFKCNNHDFKKALPFAHSTKNGSR